MLIAFLKETFIENIIIIICINYIITIYINNKAIININNGTIQKLNLLLKFPWARERISLKFMYNLGTCPQIDKPALLYRIFQHNFYNSFIMIQTFNSIVKRHILLTVSVSSTRMTSIIYYINCTVKSSLHHLVIYALFMILGC